MNILGELLGSQNGQALQQLARQFGLNEEQTRGAVGSLLPAVSQGLKKQMGSQQGFESLLGALSGGNHSRYVDEPESLTDPRAVEDGNGILGHIFGSKDVSRQVASQAASSSGIDLGILKKMLPMVAGMAMGSLSKKGAQASMSGSVQTANPAEALGGLSSFLDMDGDGSVADDLLNFARKLF